jgi:hypothetical protein
MNKNWKSRMQTPAEMAWLAPGELQGPGAVHTSLLVTHLVPISPNLVSISLIFGLWRDTSFRVGAAELFRTQRISC